MSITSALNIGATALTTQQQAMDVLAHNIANVNTQGYSRQRPILSSASPEQRGGFVFGRGVQMAEIRRQVDLAIQRSLGNSAGQKAMWTQITQALTAVESAFGSLGATGLAASFDHFFASWQQLANNPQDTAQKANVQIATQELVTTLTSMRAQLRTEQINLDGQIDTKLADVNLLLDRIASLNTQIVRKETSKSVVGPANDLRDQREQALQDLAALIPIQRVDNPDGSSLVQTPGGDLLVQDGLAHHLVRGTTFTTNGFHEIALDSAPAVPLSGMAQSGTVGGMIEVRDNRYQVYIDQLDSIARNLIFSANQIYSNGSTPIRGSTMISGQASLVSTAARQSTIKALQSVSHPTAALVDSGLPAASKIKSGSFEIYLRDSTGAQINTTPLTITIDPTVTVLDDSAAHGGVATTASVVGLINQAVANYNAGVTAPNPTISLTASTSGGVLQLAATGGQTVGLANDSSNLLSALGMTSSLLGTSGVPFANQIKAGSFKIHIYDSAGTPINPGGLTITIDPAVLKLDDSADNGGTATTASVVGLINQAVANYNAGVTAPNPTISLTASTTANGELKLVAGNGQTIGFSDDTSNFLAAYEINALFHGADGADLALDSTVAANSDRINIGTIDSTTSKIFAADNQTASAMFALQQTKVSVDDTTPQSLHSRYSDLSAQYGIDVANAQRNQTYRSAEYDSLTSQRNSISGVNMDEELIEMLKFQRAYQSSAKVVQITNQMLDALMGLIR
ncbi:MAG: flagellar hook-associated protein FlgK [Zetaproteobacteria bacterium]|nr:MAG: flagellar hook-associated protein FlgK [Zetaproteobacteria bacterium]